MKKLVWLFLILTVTLSFAAKDIIVVGTTDKIRTLDPANCYDYFSSNILQNVMVGLVDYEIGTSVLKPVLAERWEVDETGTVYTFYLRKDAKFEDGTPIDAHVFKYSFDRVMKLNGDPAFLLSDVVEKTEVVDDYTFRVTLKYPFSAFVSVLGYTVAYPVNPKVYPADSFYEGIPSASGPYRVKEWIRDVRIVLEANPNYFGEKPKTKTIVINFYENASTLRLALETGEIDVAYRHLDPRDVIDLEGREDIVVYKGNSPQIRYLVINVTQPPFDNVKVRQALAYSVNRDVIVEDVFVGLAKPLYSMIPEGMWGHKDVFPERDLEKARALLKEAGYDENNPLVIDLWYTPSHYGTTEADVAQVLKESFEETGVIKVNLKYAEWSTYVEYFLNGTMGLFLLGWYPDYLDPDDYVWPFLSESGAKSLGSFYSNPEVENLMIEARKLTDLEKRTEIYYKVQEILARDVPYIPLWQGVATCAAKKQVKGILLEPTQIFRYYILYWEE
ncbi:peptide ABC transporter substrate-binding protein [Thermotoga maritima MSB8]|nr:MULTISPECIES: ABC transporter substrate-binding protein [Thermotoga]AGL50081.1 Dipeptide-binding ABC transporter, periplasmic substrate-binding component [Thermotoga maritima MSB8]AHD18942.1 peptide ABC transporter substrate-binding protein [Thermotoga maritima MSB8]AIY87175.1 peptide ABC transporter substrate-binding protein [Thermotoga sp. 2812B]AKE27061.1 peptide ABC transporter substrate-binding protein [Thermotoga maritima]AKE28926.1 peptide ABC transporter substrate-binding protein [T